MATSRLEDNLSQEEAAHDAQRGLHQVLSSQIAQRYSTDTVPHHTYAQAVGQVCDTLETLNQSLSLVFSLYETGDYRHAADVASNMAALCDGLEERLDAVAAALRQAKG